MAQVSPLLNEKSADLIIEHIKSAFNLKLTELDNQYSDGISLEPLDDQHIYISDKFESLGMPACYVLFGTMAFNYTDNPNYLDATNECVVVLTGMDVGADVLMRKMWRYGRVLYSTLNLVELKDADDRLLTKLVARRLGYSDQKVSGQMPQMEQKFRQDLVLELDILHYEKNLTDI